MAVVTESPGRVRRRHPLAVWRDAAGRLSGLRIVALAFLLLPLAIAIFDGSTVGFGPRPVNDLIHRTGYWALIFVLATLAVTPLRRIGRFGKLIDVRRMLGVGAFVYAAAHVLLYVIDLKFDIAKVASEIVLRLYLTIGFVALTILLALAITSTDAMVRRLGGRRWALLHQAVYVAALLALIHHFQQTKADVWVPTLVAGIAGWLFAYRLALRLRKGGGELTPAMLAALAVAVAALTFAAEAVGIGIAFKVSPMRVLGMAFDFDYATVRPGWFVLAAGLLVAAIDLVRRRMAPQRSRRAAAPGAPAAPAG